MRVTLYGGNNGNWNGAERLKTWPSLHGSESWVLAFAGLGHDAEYREALTFKISDWVEVDLILLNISFGLLDHYLDVLARIREQYGSNFTLPPVVAIHDPALEDAWQGMPRMGEVMDMCDLVLTINGNDRGFLQSMTTTPVRFIGYPVPIDAIAAYTVPIAERRREIFLCSSAGDTTPFNWLAAKDLGLPMWTCGAGRDSAGVVIPGGRPIQAQPGVEYVGELHQEEFFKRAAQSLLWVDLTHRYTWSRYVIEGACLGVPVIATDATLHNRGLFGSIAMRHPFQIENARLEAREVIGDYDAMMTGTDYYYASVCKDAHKIVRERYSPSVIIKQLSEALTAIGKPIAL